MKTGRETSSRVIASLVTSAFALLLTACGGGGGGGGQIAAQSQASIPAPAPAAPAPAPATPVPTPPTPPPAPVTYPVGGLVSGLIGSGLRLQDANGGSVAISADGAFQLPNAMVSGSAYDLHVATQPRAPAQVCAVENASGSVVDQAIASIRVVCPPVYTLRGTVTGLAGPGLRLRSGLREVGVAADGPFEFAPLGDGATTFTIEVVNAPDRQSCSIANATGVVDTAAATDIRVTCVTDRFTVGGVVTGLQGTGLQLTSNPGGSVSIGANGSFVFPQAVRTGVSYDVAVTGQPAAAVACRVVDRSGRGVVGDASVTSIVIACGARQLPPWIRFCDGGACDGSNPIVVRVCPENQPSCVPSRSTRIHYRLDGKRINAGMLLLNEMTGKHAMLDSGNAQQFGSYLQWFDAPYIVVSADADITFTYYDVVPGWGGTTNVDFVSDLRSNSSLDSTFYRHASYATGSAVDELFEASTRAIDVEQAMVDASSEKISAHFLPTELIAGGEGNYSYGNGTVTINYGNPPYIQAFGGIYNTSMPRFAHENAHELFNEIDRPYGENPSCLNEGIADALGYRSGFLPENEFGPAGLQGLDFELDGCLAMTEMHDVGNCPLWFVKKAGQLTPSFLRGLFHPQHDYRFDSCTLNRRTGNSLLVMYTEAAGGANMAPVLDAAGIPHAGTYQAAKSELGL